MTIGVFTGNRPKTAPQGRCVFLALFLLAVSLLGGSCRHPDDPPPPPAEPDPGKRDYVWTYDTLNHPESFQTDMEDIWASSPHDVYVVGHNDRGPVGCMYRYDGGQWTSVKLHVSEGGTINAGFELHAIYGFDSTNIWAVGYKLRSNPNPPPNIFDSTYIIHYDGSAWRETPMERRYGELLTIWGSSPNDIWAGGTLGNLYHFTSGQWSRVSVVDGKTAFRSITGFSPNLVYMTSVRSLTGPDTVGLEKRYFNRWDGSVWRVIDSSQSFDESRRFGSRLWASPYGELYSASYGVTRYLGDNSWKLELDRGEPVRIGGGGGINVYAVGDYWTVFHWNGSGWITIPSALTGSGWFAAVWSNNVETFIIGHNGRVTYIMHGR